MSVVAETPVPEPAKTLKSTLNLPQTAFPMKANLPQNEPARLESWDRQDLYGKIRAARSGSPKFILHDGPPYANGAIHLGHALNKCIKDFVVKTKTMAGFDAPYVPGWDCHGLPIEIKVDEQLGRKKLEMPAVSVRRACREYAQKYVDLQRQQFKRIGVFGRWNDPYLTMSHTYEAAILEIFYAFFERGFVYKGLKPVFWCIHDQTALAEAEVEYEQHTSPSVYVRYKLGNLTNSTQNLSDRLRPLWANTDRAFQTLGTTRNVFTIIWTTTPWTIPASQAVAFNPDLNYVAVVATRENEPEPAIYIVAEDLQATVMRFCALHVVKTSAPFPGAVMANTEFLHPLSTEPYTTDDLDFSRRVKGVLAPYVTADQGTGVVHTAPAHGVDDFYTGKREDLPELQYVDNAGRQRNTPPQPSGQSQPYEGLTVFESNAPITELLRASGALLAASHFEHSYPHCWRCHNPVIVRATEQWFIGMETPMPSLAAEAKLNGKIAALLAAEASAVMNIDGFSPMLDPLAMDPESYLADDAPPASAASETFRQRALSEIKKVTWDPSWGEERISNMIATRPDWCISRQRIWGVPIAVFLCNKCHQPLNSPTLNESIVDLFKRESADAWYKHAVADLLPSDTVCASCGNADTTEFRKEMDILDVWFESGASWHAVLDAEPSLSFPADLYTEGGDQHRGWFHSSLLTSVALRGVAPYRQVATSGWTLDEHGRAFSKSLGNGVDPVDVAKRLGAEIVRLWVASVDFREDVAASENLMQRVGDNYRKLRNTLRFLLGNLHDFVPAVNAVAFAEMEPLDQYILVQTAKLDAKIRGAYDTFEFHRAYHALNEFVNTDLSALYLDVLKDRLYTFAPNHPARRSAQTALWRIAEALTRLIAPILSFTADEVWPLLPHVEGREESVHLAMFPDLADIVPGNESTLEADWEELLSWRETALKSLEGERNAKRIGKGLEAAIRLVVGAAGDGFSDLLFARLMQYRSSLPELFNVSEVEVMRRPVGNVSAIPEAVAFPASGTRCERCWRHVADVGREERYPTVCLRCAEALEAIGFAPYSTGDAGAAA